MRWEIIIFLAWIEAGVCWDSATSPASLAPSHTATAPILTTLRVLLDLPWLIKVWFLLAEPTGCRTPVEGWDGPFSQSGGGGAAKAAQGAARSCPVSHWCQLEPQSLSHRVCRSCRAFPQPVGPSPLGQDLAFLVELHKAFVFSSLWPGALSEQKSCPWTYPLFLLLPPVWCHLQIWHVSFMPPSRLLTELLRQTDPFLFPVFCCTF